MIKKTFLIWGQLHQIALIPLLLIPHQNLKTLILPHFFNHHKLLQLNRQVPLPQVLSTLAIYIIILALQFIMVQLLMVCLSIKVVVCIMLVVEEVLVLLFGLLLVIVSHNCLIKLVLMVVQLDCLNLL